MKRCKHENTIALAWSRDRKYCRRCFETIPLGPAADDSPEVQIEIRAVELAAAGHLLAIGHPESPTDDEWHGWMIAFTSNTTNTPSSHGEHAGYLARLIYEHKEEA